ncbi:MAG: hypothetical protein NTZ05_12695, partial [Chloroflexi bacterium]|nr:hypothetical protein [Chloroflexota bacterium]
MNRAVSVWTSLAAASLLAVSLFSIAFAGAALGGLSGRPYTNTRPATAGFVVASPFVEPAAPSLPPAPPQAPVYAKAIQQATAPAVAVQTQSPSTDEMLPLTVPPPFVPLPRVETTFTALSLAPQSDRQFWAPIMMYHHVGPLPPDADAGRRDLTV